ncbi:hypothetical protein CspHIS471_0401850 [Cutaneotrichosporon sp. HIS471]|nr:hypothetical protein CspHIS471_0401850 [Cutaneotrichosporon sp. HIS471]
MKDEDNNSGSEHEPPPTRISCVECRRLKRKCDRIQPCNQCKRYGKTCVFPEPEVPRRGKKYIAEMRDRMARLEGLLAEHAPHLNIDDAAGADPDGDRKRKLPSRPPSPGSDLFRPPPSLRTPPGLKHTPGSTHSLLHHPTVSPASSQGLFDHAPLPAPINLRPPPTLTASMPNGATPDAYERQPRHASGYEWCERHANKGHDGTASLSVEPDNQGYLGFASGASLLRILQITAGGVSLAGVDNDAPVSVPPPDWMPTHPQVLECIDAYFQHYHTQYPILHEATFRAQFAQVIAQPDPSQWNLLVNTVIALGAFCAGMPMYFVDHFLERADAVINVGHLETGSLVLVQAFTLLSNISQKRNKSNSGSVYLGIAIRMAIGLGLHRELPLWNIKPFEREVRRRVWWVLFIFDAGACITFGRPILLPYLDADVKMVHNVQDRDFTPSSATVPPPARETTVYSSLIHQASLVRTGNLCYTRVISTPPPPSKDVLELDAQLRHSYSHVPAWMSAAATVQMFSDTPWLYFSAHKLFWRYCNLRIIMARRAFLERALKRLPLSTRGSPPSNEPQADYILSDVCLSCATDTIDDIQRFFKDRIPNALEKWYGLHFLFQASFVPLIALHADPGSPDQGIWHESIRLATETLRQFKGDPLADRCMRILDILAPPSQAAEAQNEVNSLFEFLQTNPMWADSTELAGELMPFADFSTLMAFFPPTPGL